MLTNNDKNAETLDQVFTALANKSRREIVYTLGLQPASVTQLARQQKMSLPAIHRHILVLEQAKLITRKKVGKTNFLALDRSALLLMQEWIAQYKAYWGTNEETLENYVARIQKDEAKLKNGRKK
jgi:DNA-binding transcriptional ArsR family regulator